MRNVLQAALTFSVGLTLSSTAFGKGPLDAHYADDIEGVMWFMHISDLHVGSTSAVGPDYAAHDQFALTEAFTVINPSFVVTTGDIVDGSPWPLNLPTTGQGQEEWDEYKKLYTDAKLTFPTYVDLPGNHDGYGDVGLTHYLDNSLLGTTEGRPYTAWTVTTSAGEYLFYGFCTPGNGSGPFNEDHRVSAANLEDFQATLQQHSSAALVFGFGHHPLHYVDNADEFTAAVGDAQAFYLHGHVHDYSEYVIGNNIVVNQVDSMGQKDVNNLAVGVIDHNAFIYRASSITKPWPLMMITAPVSTTLRGGSSNPYAYPICKNRHNNPVRAVVFSKSPPTLVTAQIGSSPKAPMDPLPAPNAGMWVGHVDTTELSAGDQSVTIVATIDGQEHSQTIVTRLIEGPCSVFGDAGTGGSGGQGTGGSAGTGGSSGAGGKGGAGGSGGSGLGGHDAGIDSSAGASGRPDASESGGTGGHSGKGAGGEGASGGDVGSGGNDTSGGAAGDGPQPGIVEDVPSTSSDSGCGCQVRSRLGTWGWIAFVAVAVGLARRRGRSTQT